MRGSFVDKAGTVLRSGRHNESVTKRGTPNGVKCSIIVKVISTIIYVKPRVYRFDGTFSHAQCLADSQEHQAVSIVADQSTEASVLYGKMDTRVTNVVRA